MHSKKNELFFLSEIWLLLESIVILQHLSGIRFQSFAECSKTFATNFNERQERECPHSR